jgi:hypothetical protein
MEKYQRPGTAAWQSRFLELGFTHFPTTFVIDKAGKIRHAEVGFTTEIGLRFRAFLSTY